MLVYFVKNRSQVLTMRLAEGALPLKREAVLTWLNNVVGSNFIKLLKKSDVPIDTPLGTTYEKFGYRCVLKQIFEKNRKQNVIITQAHLGHLRKIMVNISWC